MTATVSRAAALAWRMHRQMLDRAGTGGVADVAERLAGVQAQVPSSAELAVRVRLQGAPPGVVADALASGAVIRTWAMRGTLHLLEPRQGADLLSVIAAARPWKRPSWIRAFGLDPAGIERLRVAVTDALEDGRVLDREALVEVVAGRRGLEDAAEGLRSSWGTLLKTVAWQGGLCLGPSRGNRTTFQRPDFASPTWPGLPDPDEAGPRVAAAYLAAHGPATPAHLGGWLAGGWFAKRQLAGWFESLGDRLAAVDVEGERAFVLREHVDDLLRAAPTTAVRLLPGFDQYVLGPGTGDPWIVAPGRRAAVSRAAGWIAPVVIAGGVVAGTWDDGADELRVEWFEEAGPVPTARLEHELARLASMLDRPRSVRIEVVARPL